MAMRGTLIDDLPPLPLDAAHWQAIFAVMKLSSRQSEIAALIARCAPLKQISIRLNITISTIRTQQERIFHKAGVRNRGEFLLHVLDVSHHVCGCRQK